MIRFELALDDRPVSVDAAKASAGEMEEVD